MRFLHIPQTSSSLKEEGRVVSISLGLLVSQVLQAGFS